SIDLQEAFETALGLGLELCASESARLEDRVRALERALRDLQGALAAVGSAVFGVRALLVGWAAREAFAVGEDELAAELSATGEGEWALSLAERHSRGRPGRSGAGGLTCSTLRWSTSRTAAAPRPECCVWPFDRRSPITSRGLRSLTAVPRRS